MLRPIRNRVLVRPDSVETETESGLIIPDTAKDTLVMSGEVVALGPECHGPSYRLRAAVLSDVEHVIERVAGRSASATWTEELLAELRALLAGYYDDSQDVAVGAHVCFPYTVGTAIHAEESFLLVKETDLSAIWQPDEAVVEARVA